MKYHIHLCIPPVYRMAGRWTFEEHAYCGPTLLDANGEPTTALLDSETHPFWGHYERWVQQGRRVDNQARCLVDWVTRERA